MKIFPVLDRLRMILDRQLAPGHDQKYGSGWKYGPRRNPLNPSSLKKVFHFGVDLGENAGEVVRADRDGVINCGKNDLIGFWIMLIYSDQHEGYMQSRFCHLEGFEPGIVQGLRVRQGQAIARVGATGIWCRGSHLHFEIYKKDSSANVATCDPLPLLLESLVEDPAGGKIPFEPIPMAGINERK